MKKNAFFVLVLVLSFFLRFYQLSQNPPALNWDEISHGYNAYSLLQTGKDQWGNVFPLFNFRAYGDYPMVLNLYLTIPSIIIFGLNEFAIRFPSALLGSLFAVVSYFFGIIFFKNKSYALLLMFLAAIAPWTILPSRAVFQSSVSQFFLFLGITLFLYAVNRLNPKLFFIGLLSLAISGYGYHNARIFVPIFFPVLIFLHKGEIKKIFAKYKLITIVSFSIFFILTLFQLLNLTSGESRARSRWVFAIDEGAINYINEKRGNLDNPIVGKVVYNKATYLVSVSITNFLSYLSPNNLFFEGGTQYQFSVPKHGVLYSLWMPFFYLGLLIILYGCCKKDKNSLLLFLWLILGLLPAIITKDSFQVIRAVTILPIPMIFIVLGIKKAEELFSGREKFKKLFIVLFVGGSLILLLNYWQIFWTTYRQNYSWAWQYGYKEAVAYVKDKYQNYDEIYFTKRYGEPHEFVLFYWPWNPKQYLLDKKLEWEYRSDWYWVNSFDKFIFVNDWEMKINNKCQMVNDKCLMVTSPGNYPEGWKLLKTINFLDDKPAFDLLEKQNE